MPLAAPLPAAVSTGKFWSSFAPVSTSSSSFGVTPSAPRSIPSPPFPSITFSVISLPVVEAPKTNTPAPVLWKIVFACSSVLEASETITPMAFPTAWPFGATPTRLSSTWFSSEPCQMPMPEYGPPAPKPLPPITFRRIVFSVESKSARTPYVPLPSAV